MFKRIFDFISSLLGLIALSPFIIILVLINLLVSPGPPIFMQTRVGQFGRSFKFMKFRTMTAGAEEARDGFNAGDRSRITPMGHFLRKTKLDELPQLINVLKGDMSIVGPRPEVKQWTDVYPEKWAIVHRVRPGITDYASIIFRNEEEILADSVNPEETYKNEILPKKLDLNIEYINSQTFFGDIRIIFRTIYTILFK